MHQTGSRLPLVNSLLESIENEPGVGRAAGSPAVDNAVIW
jgi:hypothetical protein